MGFAEVKFMTSLRDFTLGVLLVFNSLALTSRAYAGAGACAQSIAGRESEESFRSHVQNEIEADQKTLSRMQDEPAQFYFEERAKAQKHIALGKQDIPFDPHLPVLKRISKDLRLRKIRKFGDMFADRLESLAQKADQLIAEGGPNKKTIRFIMYEYLTMLDDILIQRHPDLSNSSYHRHHAEHKLEEYLHQTPDLFLIFSFESIGPEFFIRSRSVPLQLIGIDLRGLDDDIATRPHADKYDMKVSEFAWHDIGHVDFMAGRDLVYVLSDTKPLERVVWEWEHTKNRIMEVIDQVRATNPLLAESMVELVSELMHERGFQYSLSVMKQELETPKWVEVILKKWNSRFYDKLNPNPKLFDHLEEARVVLYNAVLKMRSEDQLQWITTLNAEKVPVKVQYVPQLGYSRGQLTRLEIRSLEDIVFFTKNAEGQSESTSIKEAVTAQVSPITSSPLTHEVVHNIAHLLESKSQNKILKTKSGVEFKVDRILISRDGKLAVKTEDKKILPFEELSLKPQKANEKFVIPNLGVFEIDQVLGSAERNELSVYTMRRPTQIFSSKIRIEHDWINGVSYFIHVVDENQQSHRLPLADVRIDPLHN